MALMVFKATQAAARQLKRNRNAAVCVMLLAGVCLAPVAAMAQETTGTAASDQTTATFNADAVSTTATADQKANDLPGSDTSAETTHTIVLLGERSGLDSESPRQEPFPDLLVAAQSVLGTEVADYTSMGLTLAETAQMVKNAPDVDADVALIFGGFADERQEKAEDAIRTDAMAIAAELTRRNPDMRIFLMPGATYVGTLTNAQLRLAAEDANMTFISLGTEVGGEPFREAMRSVADELREEPEAAEPATAPATAQQTPVAEEDAPEPIAAPPGTPVSYDQRQALLQQELNRVAGDTTDSAILPMNVEQLSTQSLVSGPATGDASTTGPEIPPGGTVTRRGREAQQNINMRPLPALKAYEPQIPVPRNEIEKKEPALSR